MKNFNFFLLLLFLMITKGIVAQVKIGDNPNTIHAKAILELDKTDKGFLPPRLTTAQMNAMFPTADATAKGMTIFNTDTNCTYMYDGAAWKSMCDPNDHDWYMNSGTTDAVFVSNNDSTIFRKGDVVIGSNYNALNPVENFLISAYGKPKVFVNGKGGFGIMHFDTMKTGVSAPFASVNIISPTVAGKDFYGGYGANSGFNSSVGADRFGLTVMSSSIEGTGNINKVDGDVRSILYKSASTGTTTSLIGRNERLEVNNHAGIIETMANDYKEIAIASTSGVVRNVYGDRNEINYNSNDNTTVFTMEGQHIRTKYSASGNINNLNGLFLSTSFNSNATVGAGDGFAYFNGINGIYNSLNIENGTGAINPGSTLSGTKQELWYKRTDGRTEPFYGSTNRMYVIYPTGSSITGEPKLGIGYDIQMGPFQGSPGLFVKAIGYMAGNRGRDTSIAYTIRFGQSENASGNGLSYGFHVPSDVLHRASGAKVRAFINEDVNVQSTFMGNTGIGVDGAARKLHVKHTGAATSVRLENIPQYANDAAAGLGGLISGDVYCTNVGGDLILKIKI
jgi:hypothetical protein